MIAICKRAAVLSVALLAVIALVDTASAVCFGCGTTANYPSAYAANYGGAYNTYYAGSYNAYYPATYQTNYAGTGWYPGYYWDRVRTRLWGSPSTYVAAYPTTTYHAGYAPSYNVSYAPTYAASYAAPAAYSSGGSTCQSCTAGYAPCNSCSVQQVTMRPVCTTACSSPCSTCTSGCSAGSAHVVTQTSYEQPACACHGHGSHERVQQVPPDTQSTPDEAPLQRTFGGSSTTDDSARPEVPANTSETERREEQKPPTNGTETQSDPGPGTNGASETPVGEFYKVEGGDNATMFEAPKLHDPNDRTAWRSIAPVKTALYKQPVAHRNVSTQRVTAEQAKQDAIGWTSVPK